MLIAEAMKGVMKEASVVTSKVVRREEKSAREWVTVLNPRLLHLEEVETESEGFGSWLRA
jgi:hypothetical protein